MAVIKYVKHTGYLRGKCSEISFTIRMALLEIPVSGWMYWMILDHSVAIHSWILSMTLLGMALLEIPVSGWMCNKLQVDGSTRIGKKRVVDVGKV